MFGVPLINIAALAGSLGFSIVAGLAIVAAFTAIGLPMVGVMLGYAGAMSILIALLIETGKRLGFKRK